MTRPTGADLEAWSNLNLAALGYEGSSLALLAAQAVAYVEQVTGRIPIEDVPDPLVPLAQFAVRMRAEQVSGQSTAEYVESASDDLVQSFSAGSYSETRRDGSTAKGVMGLLNDWKALHDVLWLLLTDAKREEYLELVQGKVRPAFAVVDEDWSPERTVLWDPGTYPPGGAVW